MYNFFNMLKLPAQKQKGFTLIELLIVIMIIAVLAGLILTVLNSQGLRAKSRDSQRTADLKKMQAALELYFADRRTYPNPNGWRIVDGGGSDIVSAQLEPNYINDVPIDPRHVGGNANPCGNVDRNRYNYWSNGTVYVLTAIMEIDTTNDGFECTTLNNWPSTCGGTFATSNFCYGVESP